MCEDNPDLEEMCVDDIPPPPPIPEDVCRVTISQMAYECLDDLLYLHRTGVSADAEAPRIEAVIKRLFGIALRVATRRRFWQVEASQEE